MYARITIPEGEESKQDRVSDRGQTARATGRIDVSMKAASIRLPCVNGQTIPAAGGTVSIERRNKMPRRQASGNIPLVIEYYLKTGYAASGLVLWCCDQERQRFCPRLSFFCGPDMADFGRKCAESQKSPFSFFNFSITSLLILSL